MLSVALNKTLVCYYESYSMCGPHEDSDMWVLTN